MNRNTKKEVQKDIEFLEEMKKVLEKAPTDKVAFEHLKTMIIDWREELTEYISAENK